MKRGIEMEILPRRLMARVVFGWLLLVLIYFFMTHSMVHQWKQPPLIYPEADNTYWILHMLNIPELVLQTAVFSYLMFCSVLLFFIFPDRVIFAAVSIICLWLFQIIYGSVNGHHYHHIGYLLLPLPFLFRSVKKFYFSWELVRYWILFLFSCSGLYKIYYGGFFQTGNMSSILKMHDDLGTSWISSLNHYLIVHPSLAQLLYQGATLLQLVCLLGFISRRFDRVIFFSLLLFNLANMIMLRIPFWENALVLAPFLPWRKLAHRKDMTEKEAGLAGKTGSLT